MWGIHQYCHNKRGYLYSKVYIIQLTNGLYYKHVTIVNYATSSINKLRASLNDDARVVIYDRHMFIAQATRPESWPIFYITFSYKIP
jgi:hypothetical protein